MSSPLQINGLSKNVFQNRLKWFLVSRVETQAKDTCVTGEEQLYSNPYLMCTCVGSSSGKNPSDDYLEGMMSEAPGPINFTMFLTMFGERLNGTDPEDVIRNAFACFDEEGSGERQ